jgi:hypothetical protein
MENGKCGETLMEDTWAEGFECSMGKGHAGPHRDQDASGVNVGTDVSGRGYRWVHEWWYV